MTNVLRKQVGSWSKPAKRVAGRAPTLTPNYVAGLQIVDCAFSYPRTGNGWHWMTKTTTSSAQRGWLSNRR